MRFFRSRTIAPAGLVLLMPLVSFATPITGELNITGDAVVSLTNLTFQCDIGGVPCTQGTSGAVHVTALSSGDFQQFANDTAVIQDLNLMSQPIGQTFSLANWITFNVPTPNVSITLNEILPGVYGQAQCLAAPAAGQTCTPALPGLVTPSNPMGLSPFNLSNTQLGSTASFTVLGTAVNTVTGETSQMVGVFSREFAGQFYQTQLGTIIGGGTVHSAFSANFFATAVPEPASWSFMIGGLMLFGAAILRRVVRRREQNL